MSPRAIDFFYSNRYIDRFAQGVQDSDHPNAPPLRYPGAGTEKERTCDRELGEAFYEKNIQILYRESYEVTIRTWVIPVEVIHLEPRMDLYFGILVPSFF